jgi:hypothetical protein
MQTNWKKAPSLPGIGAYRDLFLVPGVLNSPPKKISQTKTKKIDFQEKSRVIWVSILH